MRVSAIFALSGPGRELGETRWCQITRRRDASASTNDGVVLAVVPRALRPGRVRSAVRDVPEPHRGVDPKRQGGGPLGPFGLPALGLLATEGLLHRPKGVLDRPAPGVAGDDVGGEGVEVGGEEEVVVLDALRVAHHHEQDLALGAHPVPQHRPGQQEPAHPPPPHVHLGPHPSLLGGRCQGCRGGKAGPLLGRPAPSPGAGRRGVIESGVPSHPRHDVVRASPAPAKDA